MAILGVNTPEFGLTERVSDFFGLPRNQQGGSQLGSFINPLSTPYTPPQSQPQPAPQQPNYSQPNYSTPINQSPAVGVGGGGSGTKTTTTTRPAANPPASTTYTPQTPDLGVFNDLIAPALQALEGGVGAAQSSYDSAVANANAQYGKQVGQQEANTQSQYNQLGQRQTAAENTTQNAIAEARRGYSEMSQGIQAKFGGVTGTGAFANAILGSQTQRNIASYQNQLSQSIQQLNDTRGQIKLVHDQALQDLESSKSAAISDAKARLDNAIQGIRMKQGELQSNKASMMATALQNYQSEVNRANQLSAEFAQKLYEQGLTAQQTIDRALATQQQKQANLQLIYGKENNPVGVFNPTTGVSSMYNGTQMLPYGYLFTNQSKKPQEQGQPYTPAPTDENVY